MMNMNVEESHVTPKRSYSRDATAKSNFLQCLHDSKSDPLPRSSRRFLLSSYDSDDGGVLMDGVLATSAIGKSVLDSPYSSLEQSSSSRCSSVIKNQHKNAEFSSPRSDLGRNQETTTRSQHSLAMAEIQEEVIHVHIESPPMLTMRERYLKHNVALCRACIAGDWKEVEALINAHPHILNEPITRIGGSALHLAVAFGHKMLVEKLLRRMDKANIMRKDTWECTALCIAASMGNIEILRMIVEGRTYLVVRKGVKDQLPLQLAATNGHHKAAYYLFEKTSFPKLEYSDMGELFLTLTNHDLFDLALKILTMNKKLATFIGRRHVTALYILANKPNAFHREISWYHWILKTFSRKAEIRNHVYLLLEQVWEAVIKLPEDQLSTHLCSPTRIIFDAARSGNVEFLKFLFSSHPDLVYMVDEKGQSIYHIAVTYRHEEIFSTIYELGAMKNYTCGVIDVSGNTLLHFVASVERVNLSLGPTLLMQHEVLWYKAVEDVVPRYLHNHKNCDNLTAKELFLMEHKNMKEEGEKWLKETSSSCMIVAALMTTITFASIFTVPGGSDEKTNLPNFGNKAVFDVFILSAGIGLSTSLASLLTFLSIITSRYKEDDFKSYLPVKLMIGLITLYFSIVSMLVTFTSALIMIRGDRHRWGVIIVASSSSVAAFAYIILHMKLWFLTFRSAYHSRRLFSHKGNKSLVNRIP